MLQRKIYQLSCNDQEVWVFLRDQQRWIEQARITNIEADIVTLRYETDDDDEVCSWEEMVRIDSIGAITRRLASVPLSGGDLPIAEDCPESEQVSDSSEPNPD